MVLRVHSLRLEEGVVWKVRVHSLRLEEDAVWADLLHSLLLEEDAVWASLLREAGETVVGVALVAKTVDLLLSRSF